MQQQIEDLIAKMTIDEKIGQMSQVRHFADIREADGIAEKYIGSVIHTEGPVPGKTAQEWQEKFAELQAQALKTRLGIPLVFGVDAVHGQNTFDGATIFPHNIGMGATGNADLVKRAAEITRVEAQATGFRWAFAPCVAIPYNEKWGRVYEAFSESTEITTKLGVANIVGLQGNGDQVEVMATAKHFIGDGATDLGIEGGETTLTRTQVRQRLLPPYIAAINAGVGSIMASFNILDGMPMHAHKELLTDLLKNELGFEGILVSDWKAYSRFGGNDIINAGVDMVMATDGDLPGFQQGLKQGVESGDVSIERIDDAVRRILKQKFRLGLFKYPYTDASLINKIGCSEHREVARQAVRESLVLLKNNGVLPLAKTAKKIAVIGEFADSSGLQSGGWTIHWQGGAENYKGATTILQGIKNLAQGEVIYDAEGKKDHSDADIAVLVVGEKPYAEFFGDIGEHNQVTQDFQLELPKEHQQLIEKYTATGVKVVVVLVSGRAMVVTKQIEQADAFIAAWLIGSEGQGVADVLFGDYDFKGKLPHSWAKSVKDYNGIYGPNHWDSSIEPLFPLGYGLTYSK